MPCEWLQVPLAPWLRISVPVAIFSLFIGVLIALVQVGKVVFTDRLPSENLFGFSLFAAIITIAATVVAIYALGVLRNGQDKGDKE